MNNALKRLQDLLNELFQIEDAADLDFGIYRIMKHKRAEVVAFIDERLPEIVDKALEGGALGRLSAQVEERRQVTDQIRENFGEHAIGPSGVLNEAFHATPLGKRYLALPPQAPEAGSEQLDVSIFNHLYAYFSRYYDGGDFISKRRYSKRQKYAVPYNGEEVYLHWANSDQYYIKTGSYFLDYSYEAPNGITVRFRMVSAEVEHDNLQDTDRRFIPRPDEAAYDAETRALTIPFDWRSLTNAEKGLGKKQTEVNDRSVQAILVRFEKDPEAHHALSAERPEDSKWNAESYLEHHLHPYTAKNTFDFFIHKDLRGFLEPELDFYLKNEVLDVDDMERWMESGGPDFVAGRFETLRVMKQIGRGELTVAQPGSMAGYSRGKFPHWASDAERHDWKEPDGSCNVRHTALIRDGEGVQIDEDCSITAGTWLDPYTGQTVTDSSEVDIDHVVALANAWRSGASSAAWSTADREAYANDPEVLLSTDAGANGAKGDKGPDAWKPPNHDYWCEYARRWIWIKSDWHLTINPAEKSSLQEMLGTCGVG